MRKSSISLIVMGVVALLAAALAGSGPVASAQNANSSTMTKAESKPKPKSRRGRTHRKPAATADAAADASAMPEATPAPRTGRCDPTQQEQTDLSGTYTGKVNYPEASLMGDATLTITGNNFTLTAGSASQSGRVTAVTTCGYTGVTMMFGDLTPPDPRMAPAPMPAVSLRAKRMGNQVTLTSVPGETRSFSFGSAGARPRMTHKTRGRKAAPTPPPPTPPE